MSVSMHAVAVKTFVPMLSVLSDLLEKGDAHATAKGFDATVLVDGRLAPDMFPLAKHVQMACHGAEDAAARLTGKNPPPLDMPAATMGDLKALVATTRRELEKASAKAFEGAEDRAIAIPLPGDLSLELNGLELLRDWSLPQFYFHVTTTYAILRHNGVDIGIRDFASHAGQYIRKRA